MLLLLHRVPTLMLLRYAWWRPTRERLPVADEAALNEHKTSVRLTQTQAQRENYVTEGAN